MDSCDQLLVAISLWHHAQDEAWFAAPAWSPNAAVPVTSSDHDFNTVETSIIIDHQFSSISFAWFPVTVTCPCSLI